MWICSKCRTRVDDGFEVCWRCGTTIDGVEDPSFCFEDESSDPTHPRSRGQDGEVSEESSLSEVQGIPDSADLIPCFETYFVVEANQLVQSLKQSGISAWLESIKENPESDPLQRVLIRPEDWDR